jgi:O-antigen/teichoic acid export membrane protein
VSVRRNTLYNLLGAALPIAVSLLTVPAYLAYIGEARFGILSVVWLLLGYFGLFDLGLGMATAQRVAAREKGGRAVQARIFWTALMTNFALGIAGGLIAWPVAQYYFAHFLKVDSPLRVEIIAALPWLIAAVPLATVSGVATGALQGLHRFGTLNIISVAGTMLFQLLPLTAAILWSPSLTVLLPLAILARALTLLMLWVDCHHSLLKGHPVSYHRPEISVLLRFGFWVTVSAFFVPFMTIVDRFAIGAYISAAAVSAYVVPFNLADRLSILGNSAGTALFPRVSSMTREDSIKLAYNAERVLLGMMLIAAVVGIFLLAPFISLWISPQFSMKAAPAGQIVMAGIWLDSLSRVPLYALRGQFRPEAVAKIDLMQIIPYWAILYLLILRFGIEGVAAAYVFRVALNYLLLAREMGTLVRMLPMLAPAALLILLSLAGARLLTPLTIDWCLAFLAVGACAAAFAWIFLPPSERAQMRARMRNTLSPLHGR